MRVVFMGYGELGANVLRGIADVHDVRLVLTHGTDCCQVTEPDVHDAARQLGLAVRFSARATEPELVPDLAALEPDLIVSTNWRTRVPGKVLEVPRLGAINVHDSLLPAYAGFGAVNWAIRNGEVQTGLTVHFMDEELDTGRVVIQSGVKIDRDATAGAVLAELMDNYLPTTLRAIDLVAAGHTGDQQDHREASFYHRIGLDDTHIDWALSTSDLYNLVRGQSDPFVNAWSYYRGARLFIKRAAIPERAYRGTPGRVVRAAEGGAAVACGPCGDSDARGLIALEVQREGGEPVPADRFFGCSGGYLT